MKTSTKLFLSCAIWCVSLWAYDQTTLVGVALATHALLFQIHAVEVKLNKLLDDRGIFVSHRDMD